MDKQRYVREKKGSVTINYNNIELDRKEYWSLSEMNEIIEKWKLIYADKFYKAVIYSYPISKLNRR